MDEPISQGFLPEGQPSKAWNWLVIGISVMISFVHDLERTNRITELDRNPDERSHSSQISHTIRNLPSVDS